MQKDFKTYNNVFCAPIPCQAERLQIVVRFATDSEIYHLSMEVLSDGTKRFFGGRLDANDRVSNGTSTIGAGYHTDSSIPVTGPISGNQLVLQAPASSFGLGGETSVYSATGFTMAGPLEANETLITYVMRTIDAATPFDTVLKAADVGVTGSGAPNPAHVGQTLTYTFPVTNYGPSAAAGVTRSDSLAKSAGYSSSSTTQGSCSLTARTSVSCDIGTLAKNASATVTITVKPTTKGTLQNTATVNLTSPTDPNPANNTATVTTLVQP